MSERLISASAEQHCGQEPHNPAQDSFPRSTASEAQFRSAQELEKFRIEQGYGGTTLRVTEATARAICGDAVIDAAIARNSRYESAIVPAPENGTLPHARDPRPLRSEPSTACTPQALPLSAQQGRCADYEQESRAESPPESHPTPGNPQHEQAHQRLTESTAAAAENAPLPVPRTLTISDAIVRHKHNHATTPQPESAHDNGTPAEQQDRDSYTAPTIPRRAPQPNYHLDVPVFYTLQEGGRWFPLYLPWSDEEIERRIYSLSSMDHGTLTGREDLHFHAIRLRDGTVFDLVKPGVIERRWQSAYSRQAALDDTHRASHETPQQYEPTTPRGFEIAAHGHRYRADGERTGEVTGIRGGTPDPDPPRDSGYYRDASAAHPSRGRLLRLVHFVVSTTVGDGCVGSTHIVVGGEGFTGNRCVCGRYRLEDNGHGAGRP